MKIYKCDMCGIEKKLDQIVRTEFELEGFQTLHKYYRDIINASDVCEKCYGRIMKAIGKAKEEFKEEEKFKNKLKELLAAE